MIISNNEAALNHHNAKLSACKRISFLFLLAAELAVLGTAGLLGCGKLSKSAGPIRTIATINNLSEHESAAGQRVELSGVVTLSDPSWRLLAIQDETGGVLVDWPPLERNLQPGDQVEVKGATSIDNHVLSIVGEKLYRLVQVEFKPDNASMGDATHTARFSKHEHCGDLVAISRFLQLPSTPGTLIGHRIRVRGVPLGFYSPPGALTEVRLIFQDDSDIDVLDDLSAKTAAPSNSNLPELGTLSAVKLLPRRDAARGYPVRVEGVVTTPPNPMHNGYFLQEGSIGIYIHLPPGKQPVLRSGERVRIVGRTEKGGFAPVIRHLGHDMGFVPFVTGTCVVAYVLTLFWSGGRIGAGGPFNPRPDCRQR